MDAGFPKGTLTRCPALWGARSGKARRCTSRFFWRISLIFQIVIRACSSRMTRWSRGTLSFFEMSCACPLEGRARADAKRKARAASLIFARLRSQIFMSKPRCLATVKISLSPRPHMFITMIWSLGSPGAIFITWASAWLGSSAGMIPSSWHDS